MSLSKFQENLTRYYKAPYKESHPLTCLCLDIFFKLVKRMTVKMMMIMITMVMIMILICVESFKGEYNKPRKTGDC